MEIPPSDIEAWWPECLREWIDADLISQDQVLVAVQEKTSLESWYYRHVFTGLMPPDAKLALLASRGFEGHEVSATGPHPSVRAGESWYAPRFWIHGGEIAPEGMEPLVKSWRSGNHLVLVPDAGFLMTYGLVPRIGKLSTHWDDVEAPNEDVVVVESVSTYDFPHYSGASVCVRSEYLRDYSTIRNLSMVQVFYVQCAIESSDFLSAALDGKKHVDWELPGRLLDIRYLDREDNELLVQIWGVRPLVDPAAAPVTEGRWDYGILNWPGIAEPVTRDRAKGLGPLVVGYVGDTVLGEYEGRPEFTIRPDSGGVSYGNQWAVSWTRRVGRNHIECNLKKLYEGNRPATVQLWHKYSTQPPASSATSDTNVAERTKRITYGLLDLADQLSALSESAIQPTSFVKLSRPELEYSGWWNHVAIEPATRHISLTLTREAFLQRCSTLFKLAVETLSERALRKLLSAGGVPSQAIPTAGANRLGSLKLLGMTVRLAGLGHSTGISWSSGAVYDRLDEADPETPVASLFALRPYACSLRICLKPARRINSIEHWLYFNFMMEITRRVGGSR